MLGSTGKLAEALGKVQAELPKLERDRTVTVEPKDPKKPAYSYSYVTLAALNEAILPLLAKHGLAFAVMPGAGGDGKMSVNYALMHSSGEMLAGEFPISGEGGIQMIGGRITYARRYILAALVGVAADEDDESRLAEGPVTAQRAARPRKATAAAVTGQTMQRGGRPPLPGEDPDGPVGPDQHRAMHALWRELGFDGEHNRETRLDLIGRFTGRSNLESSTEMTRHEADLVIEKLRDRRDRVVAEAEDSP